MGSPIYPDHGTGSLPVEHLVISKRESNCKWATRKLLDLTQSSFFGKVTFSIENGFVVAMRKEQVEKP